MESTTDRESKGQTNYLRAIGAGLLVAIIATPVHRLYFMLSANHEYDPIFSALLLTAGLAIGYAMRMSGGGWANIIVAVAAGLVALTTVLVSEYLVAHFLVNQFRTAVDLDKALLFQPPDVVWYWLVDYFDSRDYIPAFLGLSGIVGAVYVNAKQDLVSGVRWTADAGKRRTPLLPSKEQQGPPPAARTAYDLPAPQGIEVSEGAYKLGQPVKEYRAAIWKLIYSVIVWIMAAAGMLVWWLSAANSDSISFGIFIASLFFCVAIYRLVMLFANLRNRVIICEEGILISQHGKDYAFRWEHIDKVYHSKKTTGVVFQTRVHNYQLHYRDGTIVTLRRWYEQIDELGSTILQAVTECQLPRAIKLLKAGGSVDFGTMYISQMGIHFNTTSKTVFPWPEVNRATVWGNSIRVTHKDVMRGAQAISLPYTANPHLFFTLVEQMTASKQQPGM